MGYAKVRIKPGARCYQDHATYSWPPETDAEKSMAIVGGDCIFIAEKLVRNGRVEWDCTAFGAGDMGSLGGYGNGSILVVGEGDLVELLSPVGLVPPGLYPS